LIWANEPKDGGSEMDWRERAACADADPEVFFPVGEQGSPGYDAAVREAMRYCARCPVRRACLAYAVDAEEVYGVFGGTTPEERRVEMRASVHIAEGTVGSVRRTLPEGRTPLPVTGYAYGRGPGRGVRAER
jgi:WhiB family transcriptional regulator, redox-sensing transcriptional regulator